MLVESLTDRDKCSHDMKVHSPGSGDPPAEADRPDRAVVTGRVEMHATLAKSASPGRRSEQRSMNILLMGDFSGRTCAAAETAGPPG